MPDVQVGQVIELNDGRQAKVKFVGQTSFSSGQWVGVEFEDAVGKNDGSVQGQRYFDCDTGHGMFLRPTGVSKILESPTPKQRGGAEGKTPATLKSRPSSVISNGMRRPGSADVYTTRRQTLNAPSPTPGTRAVPGANGQKVGRSIGGQGVCANSVKSTRLASKNMNSTSNASTRGATPPMSSRIASAKPTDLTMGTSTTSGRHPLAATSSATPKARQPLASSASGVGRSTAAQKAAPRMSLAARAAIPKNAAIVGETKKLVRKNSQESVASSAKNSESNPPANFEESGVEDDSETSPTRAEHGEGKMKANGHVKGSGPSASDAQQKSTGRMAPPSRQIEDLQTKLNMMERRRADDREKLKALERLQAERDRFEGIIQKLQKKFQPQQQELADLRKQVKEAEKKLDGSEALHGERESSLEMATLDREMAEETAESLRMELEALKQKAEELELEVEVLREENQEFGREMNLDEKASQGWLQMERSNDRLREALLRLRDVTQSQEVELKDQISSLEEDLNEFEAIKGRYEEAEQNLQQSEAAVEDLRQQLDAALSGEDMVEELTEKNLALNEEIEELRLNIEDLENLKELNDELEINHIEAEKQLQEELEFKDSLLGEQSRRTARLEERLIDYEYTIAKFRELVTNLHNDLEDLRASQQITETEADELGQRSKAMMDLNMKLQNSAAKTQINKIELELGRLEAQEAIEHLAIVQLFLPEAYQSEKDSVLSLLRFKRIAFKSRLLHDLIKDQVSSANSHLQDGIFTLCEIMNGLFWISAMSDRFVGHMRGCSLDQFTRYAGALYDLEPLERGLNAYIDAWKKSELREHQVAEELKRSVSVITHLISVHIQDTLENYADGILMRTLVMQNHFETTATVLHMTRSFVESSVVSLVNNEEIELEEFSRQTDALVAQSRSAKVAAGKTFTALDELKTRSMTLLTDTEHYFETAQEAVSDFASLAHRVGQHLYKALQDESGGVANSLEAEAVVSLLRRTTAETCSSADETSPFPFLSIKLRTASDHVYRLASLAADLSKTAEFEQSMPPWLLRSEETKTKRLTSKDVEAEVARLRNDLKDRNTTLRLRDQTLEEQSVKIEVLESRMRDASAKATKIAELEKALSDAKRREREILESLKKQVREATEVQVERDRWKQMADDRISVKGGGLLESSGIERTVANSRQLDDLKREIKGLQGAVRYLREDNRRARLAEPLSAPHNAWLQESLILKPTPEQQEKERFLKECKDVFDTFLDMTTNAKVVDLSTLPEKKLNWRPAKKKATWKALRQREDWESWAAWRDGIAVRGTEMLNWKKKDWSSA